MKANRIPGTAPRRASRGVTLIEVLVAVVIVSVGILGVAKMQALAIASSRTSATRSLVAIEAASVASAMHANQAFWGSSAAGGVSATVGATSITDASGTLSTQSATACTSASCTAAVMAGYDLTQWGAQLYLAVPTTTGGAVNCPAGTPITCTVTVTWNESPVAANSATAASSPAPVLQTYTLLVQP